MLTEEQFSNKWGEIKGALRNLWGRLSEEELENVKGNIYEITPVVEAKYGESKNEIKHKLNQLVESFDNETDKGIDPDISSYHRSPLGGSFAETQIEPDEQPHIPHYDKSKQEFDQDRNARH